MSGVRDYQQLRRDLEIKGCHTTLRPDPSGGFNLVVTSNETGGRLHGNSFWLWLCNKTRQWYTGTWAPYYYLMPFPERLTEFCADVLALDVIPIWRIPAAICEKYSLQEVADLPESSEEGPDEFNTTEWQAVWPDPPNAETQGKGETQGGEEKGTS